MCDHFQQVVIPLAYWSVLRLSVQDVTGMIPKDLVEPTSPINAIFGIAYSAGEVGQHQKYSQANPTECYKQETNVSRFPANKICYLICTCTNVFFSVRFIQMSRLEAN